MPVIYVHHGMFDIKYSGLSDIMKLIYVIIRMMMINIEKSLDQGIRKYLC
jgi:hypothetical protein